MQGATPNYSQGKGSGVRLGSDWSTTKASFSTIYGITPYGGYMHVACMSLAMYVYIVCMHNAMCLRLLYKGTTTLYYRLE